MDYSTISGLVVIIAVIFAVLISIARDFDEAGRENRDRINNKKTSDNNNNNLSNF